MSLLEMNREELDDSSFRDQTSASCEVAAALEKHSSPPQQPQQTTQQTLPASTAIFPSNASSSCTAHRHSTGSCTASVVQLHEKAMQCYRRYRTQSSTTTTTMDHSRAAITGSPISKVAAAAVETSDCSPAAAAGSTVADDIVSTPVKQSPGKRPLDPTSNRNSSSSLEREAKRPAVLPFRACDSKDDPSLIVQPVQTCGSGMAANGAATMVTPPSGVGSSLESGLRESPLRTRTASNFAKTVVLGPEEYELHLSVSGTGMGLCMRRGDGGRACFEKLERPLDDGAAPVIPNKGDRIVSIDGTSVASFKFDQVCSMMEDHDGRSARIIRLRRKAKPPPMPVPEYVDGLALIGKNPDRALCVILPPDENRPEVDFCREINEIYSRSSMHGRLQKVALRGKDSSIRHIQSKRFELFIRDASNKGSAFWDEVLKEQKRKKRHRRGSVRLPDDTTDRILSYAIEQARRDPRIREAPHDFKFGNFSLIMSYGEAPAQAPHVDLLAPNHQFVLCLSDGSPSTNFYDLGDEDRIRSVADLRRLWEGMSGEHEGLFPQNLAKILEGSTDFMSLIQDFGDVFHPNSTFKRIERRVDSVPVGTVLSLPGGVVHAGPATVSFRAVLFFSAVPIIDQVPLTVEYNPDTQFASVLLAGFTILVSWRCLGMTTEDRLYLLRRLAVYVRDADVKKGWERHFHNEPTLRDVVKKMAATANPKKLEECLVEHAAKEDFVFYHVQTDDFMGEFALVSDAPLYTNWDGKACLVMVFKRKADGKVLLFYPADFATTEVGVGWEGHKEEDKYRLVMHDEYQHELYNGKNGVLRDSDGDEIKCFLNERLGRVSDLATERLGLSATKPERTSVSEVLLSGKN